ncbi:MAG: HEAT repeat domain-containing protein [Planctomycetes bacterium]|nr:HEAT repeat domain-containing protein [Planctomycetota bacterium]
MKPLHTVLLALACSFAAAAIAYALFEATHTTQPPPAVTPTGYSDERVADLEGRVNDINHKLDELLRLKTEPAPQPTAPKPATDKPEKTEPEPTADANAKPAEKVKIDELAERLAEIEKRDAAELQAYIDALHKGNGREQEEAARELGKRAAAGDEAAKKAIRDAMKSEDPDVREWAIEALNGTGLAEFLPDLKALMNDPVADVREEITQTLESMPPEQAGPLLISMLNDPEPDVLLGAIEVLGDMKYTAAAADLLPLTRNPNEEVAIEASIALKRCGDPSAAESWVPTLGSRVKSTDAGERRRAVRALRQMKLKSARPYLEQALQDEDPRVRRDAERGLRDLNE